MGRSFRPVRIFPFVYMDFFQFIFLYCGSNKVVKLNPVPPSQCWKRLFRWPQSDKT
jgi:hypothetical protein